MAKVGFEVIKKFSIEGPAVITMGYKITILLLLGRRQNILTKLKQI